MFKLVISFIISVQAIQYYQDTGDAASNSTFDLANDYYCFCDLYKNISDLNCCCDPDKTNVDDQSCLVGSLKKSCFKQYIIFNQNVDKWVQVQQDNEKHELCLIYDANQPISTFITTFTSLDTTFYQDYMFNQFIPQYKPMRLDQKIVNNSWLERTYPEFYLYPDSNGICKLIKQRIDHKPMNKIRCTFAYTTSCAIVDFLGNTVTPKYVDNGNYIYSATTNTDGCIDNIRYEYAYDSLVSRITPDYVNAFLYTKTQNIYTNSQTTYTSGLNRYKSISSEVIFFNSLTNQFYNGQEGYKFGQNVPGSLTGVAFTKLGFPVYKGKQNYEVDCSTYNSSNTILDPRSYETLQFGKNVQYSCRKQMTLAECSTTTLDSLQLFHSFPIGNGTIRLSKKPLYATSLPASDMVFSNQIGIPQISSTTSTCTLQTTQLVLIYYDQYGYQGARQKYIQSIQVGYKDVRVIPDSSDVYFRVVVKFIQLTYDEIENSLPQDPSFIPQLPSDIFFPICGDDFIIVLQLLKYLMLDSKNVQIELINKLNTPNTNRVFGNYSAYVEYEYDNVNLKGNYVQKYHSKNRKITSNRPDVQLPDNSIQTSKYTLINFFPKQLYEQFSKLANIYFVIIGALQMVPEVSISQGFPTIYLPLSFIIFISGAKDFYEDYKRRKSDLDENYRLVRALEGDTFQSIQSEKLRVGQIIRVNQDEIIPADILVLRSSEPKGICYVETKSLDGETNLKQKNVHIDLIKSFDSDDSFHLEEKKIILKYQAPNPYLYKFMGEITTSEGRISSINFNNFLLRGCAVRNVRYIYGLVSYTGHDTKIMMNSFKARSKRSKLEGLMQKLTLYIFIIQIILCLFAALVYSIYYQSNREQLRYLDIDNLVSEYNFTYNLFVRFGNWILIFTNFVPISLLVTLEMVKFIQGKLMSIDPKLNEPSVQSSNLNEELGQIEHIFSDKTGTLTCNIMEFKQIIIGNQNYGDISKDSMSYITESELDQYPSVTNVNFRDKRIFEAMEDSGHIMHAKVKDCLIMLSTCHTVITDTKDGKTIFNATSPDELALLSFAKFVGYEFAGIDENNIMRIKHDDQIDEYEAVEVFEFTSTRKRQSVLIKSLKTNEIILYTKGADSVLLDPLRLSREELEQKQDFNNLNSMLQEYGKIGLRTLVLCKRMIKEDEFRVWHKDYLEAASCLENREEKMQTLQDKLEKNFNIIGATAIEDKLQADVASTIACIKQAGIKVWVLTGDKIETAINIGFSCQLLSSELTQHIVDEKEESMVRARLDEIISSINPSDDNHALIISGDALLHALKPDIQNKVMQIGDLCKVVLCCRVSPKQKQDVVSLVRNVKPTCSTLAIGDGANDVNMITAAHVGIGIRGVEGQQAARAADYAVEEFRELRRLLFYHGRECYRRNSVLVCYTFYKNTLLVLPQFWYGILSMYSAQSLYDTFIYQLFNVFYGALPIVVYGVFDEEYDADELTKNKTNYYKQGPQGLLFNHRIFWFWLFTGVWQAALLCFFATFSVSDGFVDNDGYTQHLWAQGTMIFGLVVVVCNLKVMIFSNSYSPAFLLSIFFSLTSYLLSWIVLDNIPSAEAYVVLESLFQTPNFHLGNILVIGACCGIDIAMNLKFSRALMKPQLPPQTIPQTSVIYGAIPQASFNPHLNRNVGKLTTKVQPYSGFAFNCLDREQIDEAKEEQKLYGNI